MKKSIFITCTAFVLLSLMAFNYMNWSTTNSNHEKVSCNKTIDRYKADLNLIYDVESRFLATVTKEDIDNAKSIFDILPKKATQSIDNFQQTKITLLDNNNDNKKIEHGDSDILSSSQIELLRSTDYSNNIYIKAHYKVKNTYTGGLDDRYLTYYITIVPANEAEYSNGYDALIDYLKENSQAKTSNIIKEKLKAGKVNFIITKKGMINDVRLTSTCGYNSVDDHLVEMISSIPGQWISATNAKGEKVDQELVFFFGMKGC